MRPSQASAALRQIASRIDASKSPDRSLVAQDLRRVLAAMGGQQQEFQMALYGTNEPEKEDRGSSIWWHAFAAADIVDWTPATDFAAVEAALKAAPWWSKIEPGRASQLLQSLKRNWESYQKHYMPEHVQILKSKGLM